MNDLKSKIPVDDWNIIVEKIHKRRCVPFLGAGVNFKCGSEDSLPLGADVALRLLERMIKRQEDISDYSYRINRKNLNKFRTDIREALRKFATATATDRAEFDETALETWLHSVLEILPDEQNRLAHLIVDESLDQYQDLTRVALQDLARVALRYRRNRNLPDFVDELKEIIPDTKKNVPRLLRVLANMPFRLIVTTNYDRLMERSLELFSDSALPNPNELTARIKSDGTLVSKVIEVSSSTALYELLVNYDPANPTFCIPSFAWISELNTLIQEKSLFILKDVQLSVAELDNDRWHDLDRQLDIRPQKKEDVIKNREFLEQCYPDILKPHKMLYREIVQPIGAIEGAEVHIIQKTLAQDNRLILYKLHGTFTDGIPAEETRPVITEEDYIDFLSYVGPKGDNIDNQITAELKTSTLLFLGYSLEDWNFRALFKGLVEKVAPNYMPHSYAIQKDPSEFWVRFWEGNNRNVHIFNMDICEFTEELESRYHAYVRQIEKVEKSEEKEALAQQARRKARFEASGRH